MLNKSGNIYHIRKVRNNGQFNASARMGFTYWDWYFSLMYSRYDLHTNQGTKNEEQKRLGVINNIWPIYNN